MTNPALEIAVGLGSNLTNSHTWTAVRTTHGGKIHIGSSFNGFFRTTTMGGEDARFNAQGMPVTCQRCQRSAPALVRRLNNS